MMTFLLGILYVVAFFSPFQYAFSSGFTEETYDFEDGQMLYEVKVKIPDLPDPVPFHHTPWYPPAAIKQQKTREIMSGTLLTRERSTFIWGKKDSSGDDTVCLFFLDPLPLPNSNSASSNSIPLPAYVIIPTRPAASGNDSEWNQFMNGDQRNHIFECQFREIYDEYKGKECDISACTNLSETRETGHVKNLAEAGEELKDYDCEDTTEDFAPNTSATFTASPGHPYQWCQFSTTMKPGTARYVYKTDPGGNFILDDNDDKQVAYTLNKYVKTLTYTPLWKPGWKGKVKDAKKKCFFESEHKTLSEEIKESDHIGEFGGVCDPKADVELKCTKTCKGVPVGAGGGGGQPPPETSSGGGGGGGTAAPAMDRNSLRGNNAPFGM